MTETSQPPAASPEGAATPQRLPRRADALPEPTSPFEAAVVDLLVDLFEAYPVWGTLVGYHAVDASWSDVSEAGRVARAAMLRRSRARVEALGEAELAPAERIDRGILL
ncbi:hypothetical protein BH23CHL8_BH23CHL8_24000 [soil metagenome]